MSYISQEDNRKIHEPGGTHSSPWPLNELFQEFIGSGDTVDFASHIYRHIKHLNVTVLESWLDTLKTEYSEHHKYMEYLSEYAKKLVEFGRLDFALNVLQKAVQLDITEGNKILVKKILINLGYILYTQGSYTESVKNFLLAAELIDKSDDPTLICSIYINLGMTYLDMADYAEASASFTLALDICRERGLREIEATALNNIGVCKIKTGDLKEAERHLLEGLKIFVSNSNVQGKNFILDSLADIANRSGQWDRAIRYLEEARQIAARIGDDEGLIDALSNIGKITAERRAPRDALTPLHQALELALQAQRPKSLRDIHQALAGAYKRLERPDLALEHFERYHTIERELFNEDRERTVRTLTAQFEVERVRQEAHIAGQRRQDAEDAQARAEAQVRARTADLEHAQREIVSRLAMAAEFRDDTTGEHTWRVGLSAGLIAAELGLPSEVVDGLRVAARLHDVGKIGIPDAILLKAGKLTPLEYEEMKAHTMIGARLLAGGQSEVLTLAEEIARTHHERWDGGGYPHGLAGEDIPLVGRIVAVADVFDALMQRRPYKDPWDKEFALAELTAQQGRQFDPQVVVAALQVFSRPDFDSILQRREGMSDWALGRYAVPPAVLNDATALRAWYEQLLDERTRDLEAARGEAEAHAEHMQRMALTDLLTGLPNRRAFEDDLEAALTQARRDGTSLTVLSLDLDDLKQTNDQHGHHMGDALLRAYGQALQTALAGLGGVYRMGGDEYAVIVNSGDQDRRTLAARVQAAVRQVRQQGFEATSASFGCASFPSDARSEGALLRLSDSRMYAMKRRRKR